MTMQCTLLFRFKTRIGPFLIAASEDGFHPVYAAESLGCYRSPEQAAEDLAGGHTYSIAGSVDTATLGIPYDVFDWERLGPSRATPS